MKIAIRSLKFFSESFLFLLFLVIAVTVAATFYAQARVEQQAAKYFGGTTTKITSEFVDNLEGYNSLLYAGRKSLTSDHEVTQTEWHDFFAAQTAANKYEGVSSIYYIDVIPRGERTAFERKQRQEPYFGKDFAIQTTNQAAGEFAVASLVYSNYAVTAVRGFDNYSTPDRKATYKDAELRNQPTASPPLRLATSPLGFFVTLPVYGSPGKADGFVGMSFRATDLVRAAVKEGHKDIAIKVEDVNDNGRPVLLYGSSNWDAAAPALVKSEMAGVAGRKWRITYRAPKVYDTVWPKRNLPLLVTLAGFLVIAALTLARAIHRRKSAAK
jgi:CHASE1-domain containing sensor protein